MASVKFSLDTRRPRKDNTFPLLIRLSIKDKTLPIKTTYRFLAHDWDEEKSQAKRSHKDTASVKRLNLMLEDVLVRYKKKLDALEETGKLYHLTIHQVRDHLTQKAANAEMVSFDAFTNDLIGQMKATGKLGNAQVYSETLRCVQAFAQETPTIFSDITYQWLTKFETHYLAKGNTINGLSVRMRTIRAIYNKAIKMDIAEHNAYPFKSYTIKTAETKRRALHTNDLQKIQRYQAETTAEQQALDFFWLSFYLRGMNFVDLAYLKVSQITNGRVHYIRQKTGKPFVMQVPSIVLPLIERFTAGKKSSDFALPIITKSDPEAIRRQTKSKLRLVNKTLKRIAKKLQLDETNITTYVARHTYATQAKKKGVPIAAISDMLGHKSMATTETYLDSFSNEALDEWSEVVFGAKP